MSTPPQDRTDAEIFAAYHRVDRIRAVVRFVVGGLTAVAAVTVGGVLVAATAPTVESAPGAGIPSPTSTSTNVPVAEVLPAPEASTVPEAVPVGVAADGRWRIEIGASGYQDELDACQWVRMDLAATAPIVGAHTSCGGSIVLEMAVGDVVSLAGQELDGDYVVTAARDAHAGDVAATATEGLAAVVILQTCYPGADGRLRLLALSPDPAA